MAAKKAKPKAKGRGAPGAGGGGGARPSSKPNPFELKSTKKMRFATIGQRNKGAKRNVVKAREEAIQKVGTVAGGWARESLSLLLFAQIFCIFAT